MYINPGICCRTKPSLVFTWSRFEIWPRKSLQIATIDWGMTTRRSWISPPPGRQSPRHRQMPHQLESLTMTTTLLARGWTWVWRPHAKRVAFLPYPEMRSCHQESQRPAEVPRSWFLATRPWPMYIARRDIGKTHAWFITYSDTYAPGILVRLSGFSECKHLLSRKLRVVVEPSLIHVCIIARYSWQHCQTFVM